MELQANELRIGNYVIVNDIITTVSGIEYDKGWWIDCKGIGIEYCYEDNVNPIPLTEEWLVKFGFERWNHTEMKLDNFILESSSRVIATDELMGFFDCKNDILVNKVHQLQNLYFALTGKEFTGSSD